jgi:putative transposase
MESKTPEILLLAITFFLNDQSIKTNDQVFEFGLNLLIRKVCQLSSNPKSLVNTSDPFNANFAYLIMPLPFKAITQKFTPNLVQRQMMVTFCEMTNFCIKIGLENNCHTMKRLSSLSYKHLKNYNIQSYYKLNAISQAAGRLAQMKRDIRKGRKVDLPFVKRPHLVSCYGFKINGMLLSFPIKNREFANVLLNDYVVSQLSEDGAVPRSFTITPTTLSITVEKKVEKFIPENVIGIDRNLRNITISTIDKPIMYRTEKILSIKRNSMFMKASFKRKDRRVKNLFFRKIRGRQTRRVNQYLHKISKDIVERAKKTKSLIVFEDLKGIRRLYRKGNGQGKKYRQILNSWSFYEIQWQIEYKASLEGIPVIFIDPRCTSRLCPICGDRIQEDRQNKRKMLCTNCGKSMDRDVIASMNIARKGWSRFCHPRGLLGEAMKKKTVFDVYQEPLIFRVDGSKLTDNRVVK